MEKVDIDRLTDKIAEKVVDKIAKRLCECLDDTPDPPPIDPPIDPPIEPPAEYKPMPTPPVLGEDKTVLASTDFQINVSDGSEVEIPADYNVDHLNIRGYNVGTVENPAIIVGDPDNRPVVGNQGTVMHVVSNVNTGVNSDNFELHHAEFNNVGNQGSDSGFAMDATPEGHNHKLSDIIIVNQPYAGVFCNTNDQNKSYGNLTYEYLRIFQDKRGGPYGGEGFYINSTNKLPTNRKAKNVRIANTYIEGTGREGIQATDCKNVDIDGNTLVDCGYSDERGQNRGMQLHNCQGEAKNSIIHGVGGGAIEVFAQGMRFKNMMFVWNTDTSNGIYGVLNTYGVGALTGGNIEFDSCIFYPLVPQSKPSLEIRNNECDIIVKNCKNGPYAHPDVINDLRGIFPEYSIDETGTVSYTGGPPTYAVTGKENRYDEGLGLLTNPALLDLHIGYRTL